MDISNLFGDLVSKLEQHQQQKKTGILIYRLVHQFGKDGTVFISDETIKAVKDQMDKADGQMIVGRSVKGGAEVRVAYATEKTQKKVEKELDAWQTKGVDEQLSRVDELKKLIKKIES